MVLYTSIWCYIYLYGVIYIYMVLYIYLYGVIYIYMVLYIYTKVSTTILLIFANLMY